MRKIEHKVQNNVLKNVIEIVLISLFLIPFEVILYKIFSVRALSFGCFDDCANYVTGYFILNGKTMYSQIFLNHIMGMPYLSFFIQKMHASVNIYDLVLTHRKVIMLLAFIFDILIIKRFKVAGIFFVLLYELSKFYVFGDRFLGESLVVYAVVFLAGLVIEKINKKNLSVVDYVFSGFFAWLIIFMREPYIPLSLFLFGFLVIDRKIDRKKMYGILLFLALLILVAVITDLHAFYFNDVTVNLKTLIKTESAQSKLFGIGGVQVFLYPLFLLFTGRFNNFHYFLISIDILFLSGLAFMVAKKSFYPVLFSICALGLANLRLTPPGTTYFEAYHMMVWFGLFLFLSLMLVLRNFKNIKLLTLFLGVIVMGWAIAVFAPGSYIYDKIDLQEQLLTNFGPIMNVGTVVNKLSQPSDTLFLDGADDLIYWQAKRLSSYRYSWYTSIMPAIKEYRDARITMFKNSPPDFYYDYCSKDAPMHPGLPVFVRGLYEQLYENGKPSCLYVKKSKIPSITQDQWEKAKQGFFDLPHSKIQEL